MITPPSLGGVFNEKALFKSEEALKIHRLYQVRSS